jgi:hypothetical protein
MNGTDTISIVQAIEIHVITHLGVGRVDQRRRLAVFGIGDLCIRRIRAVVQWRLTRPDLHTLHGVIV